MLLGSHTIDNGGIHMAVRRAAAAGMNTLQVFSAIPKFYNEKMSVRPERIERFTEALNEAGIRGRDVIVHASYLVGPATSDATRWERVRNALTKELERTTALGIGQFCFHPGSAGSGADRKVAAERVARAMVHALETVPGETRILVENTAGAGSTFGREPDEVAAILDAVPAEHRARVGYGLDTCHLFASGHDMASSRESLTSVLDAFEKATGEPPSFFHLNDSEGALGSNKDRHMLIGEGLIGEEPFRWLLEDKRSRGVPLILETPHSNPDVADDDPSPDPFDVRMVTMLRGWASSRS
jgi:deoxyribonuclease-4